MKKYLFTFLIFISLLGYSQEKNQMKDLKVGLVLSGGGAKGLAHIGVLKVLEEAGIRIDYIGGTSAGAMVGALYASGYNSKELDSILRSYDYMDLIQNPNSRELYSFYQKENSEKYTLSLPIKNGSIGLPVSLSKGQKMLNELSILTKHVHEITDFKKLPIPFYCITTNIETGEQVVLEDGFLPQAIRASGAFPSVFAPVLIDGKYLMDGGIVNNFSIDVMHEKDIDLIIGVDVQGKLEKKDDLDSVIDIVVQIVGFQMYKGKVKEKETTDIYIKPNIDGVSVSSFDKMDEIIISGEKAARSKIKYLVSIAAQQIKKPLVIRKKIKQYKNKFLKIKKIHIKGNKHYTRDYILSELHLNKNKKDSISYQEFNKNINRLATTHNFESIDYRIKPSKDGSIIELDLKENEVYKFFQISGHYDQFYKSGVLLNYTEKHFLTNNDIVSTDIVLGDNIRYNLNYLVDNGFHWRFGINHRYNSFKNLIYIPDDNAPNALINSTPVKYNDFTTKLYFQTNYKEKFTISGGLEHKYLNISTEVLNNNQNRKYYFDKNNYYNIFGELSLDTRDSKDFTKKGWYFKAKYNTYLYSSDTENDFDPFSQIHLTLENSTTYFDKLTTQVAVETGVTIGSANQSFMYSLGGYNKNFINNFTPFYGYDVADINNFAFMKISFNLQYEIYKKNYLSFTANVADISNELLFDGSLFNEFKTGYAFGYGMDSILGPIEFKYAGTLDNDKDYWLLNVGFWF